MNIMDEMFVIHNPVFNCPHCKNEAQQLRFQINNPPNYPIKYNGKLMYSYMCTTCNKPSFWIGEYKKNRKNRKNMIFPDVSNSPPPNNNMPKNIKNIYSEAASIANKSPRAAAALMRLALQELCQHLKCEGNTLQKNIDFLVKERRLLPHTVKAMDIVRIIGNEAVHPNSGTIDLQDNAKVEKMFELINFIVEKTIDDPKKIEKIDSTYATLPDSKKRKGTQ